MNDIRPNTPSSHFYRIDRFVVPASGRTEFLDRVTTTHELLRNQDGFVRDLIVEQQSGPSEFNIVTLVEWTDQSVVEHVSAAVAKLHAAIGFDPHEMIGRLGIRADIAGYHELDGQLKS